jgi:hypothetical protein
MPLIIRLFAASLLILLTGCSGEQVREGLYHGLYEGNRFQEKREMSPQERINKHDRDYIQYTNELKQREEESR